jgi:N-acetylmuramoyl-L-alanine amidase
MVDEIWDNATRRNLTFCIGNDRLANGTSLTRIDRSRLVTAARAAAAAWNAAAGVRFVYLPGEDARCNAANPNVVFEIHTNDLLAAAPFGAMAFFPNTPRAQRQIWVNPLQGPLTATMTHELGHVLGFRHEHIRNDLTGADRRCGENAGNFRALTAYDGNSIMHYSICRGAGASAGDALSPLDVAGARAVYGAPL